MTDRVALLLSSYLSLAIIALAQLGALPTFGTSFDASILSSDGSSSSSTLRMLKSEIRRDSSSSAPMTAAQKRILERKARITTGRGRPDIRKVTACGAVMGSSSSDVVIKFKYDKAPCGDGLMEGSESCDDGNTSDGDGCSVKCQIEAGYICGSTQPTFCWSTCGDGLVSAKEKCDDGNMLNGDGCDNSCHVEVGYNCTGSPSACTELHPVSSSSSSSSR